MRQFRAQASRTLALIALATAMSACVKDKIVYRDGLNFNKPPDAALGFLGYSNETTQQTVCGTCHVEIQARWKDTKHASAWADVVASGHASASCNGCHTTNQNGNAATTNAGYLAASDVRYQDVQCESCHGAGLTHVTSPNTTNQPLASISVDSGMTNGCGECHTGTHDPFVDEWSRSGHAQTWATSHNSTEADCMGCHTAQGWLAKWGFNENYVEKNATTPNDVVCAVCHDPHGSANPAQARFALNQTDVNKNLCTTCHQRRGSFADVTTRNSVHSPEGPTLFGTAGWFPPGMSASDSLRGTHASTSKNPTLCAGCHMPNYSVTDPTNKFIIQVTGHTWNATPCVDANGQPTASQTCAITAQSFKSCVGSNCHGTESAARSAMQAADARMAFLAATVNDLITKVKATAKKADCTLPATPNPNPTTCNGATFNVSVATKVGAAEHNPYLMEALLIASINQLKKDYGVTSSASVADLQPMFSLKRSASAAGGIR